MTQNRKLLIKLSKVGAIYEAQKAQSFQNMTRMCLCKAQKTISRHPKSAFHGRLNSEATFSPTGENIFFEKKIRFYFSGKCRIVPKNVKGGTLWDLLAYIQLQNIKKLERGTILRH